MTSILHAFGMQTTVHTIALGLLAGFLVACSSGDTVTSGNGSGGTIVPASTMADLLGDAEDVAAKPRVSGAVTHLGRTILPRSHLVLRGRVHRIIRPIHGTELAEVDCVEVFRGDLAENQRIRLFCGEEGKLPRAGQEGVFFAELRKGTFHARIVEVSPLEDNDAGTRLRTLRTYLEIEALPTRAERLVALLAHLRKAVRSRNRWTRHNAIREYAALASREGHVLANDDAKALGNARLRTTDETVAQLLDRALSAVRLRPASATNRLKPRKPVVADLTALTARYESASEAADRQGAMEQAGRLGALARPLIERGMTDVDIGVRIAAAESAAKTEDPGLGAAIHARLAIEREITVRGLLVRALGKVKFEDGRATLVALAVANGRLAREALFALARIRSPGALEDLQRLARESAEQERKDLVAFLVSEAFLEQERLLDRQ